jgi:hypothetical protein
VAQAEAEKQAEAGVPESAAEPETQGE